MDDTISRDLTGKSSSKATDSSPAQDRMHEDFASLKENFAGLREDFNRLIGNAMSLGKQAPTLASEQSHHAMDVARDQAGRVAELSKDGWERTMQKVRENPETAALIAFGVGFIAAKLLRGDRHR